MPMTLSPASHIRSICYSSISPQTGLSFPDSYSNIGNVGSWNTPSNDVKVPVGARGFSGKFFVVKRPWNKRKGVLNCATIEEIETEKSMIEKDVRERMEIENMRSSFNSIRTGSANPAILDKVEIVGGKKLGWHEKESSKLCGTLVSAHDDFDWVELEADLCHWTKALRPVQWYPGHIAKTEKELKDQLKLMDVVIEVRDARIPMSTNHPQMDSWLGNRKRIIVLNREDMISTADRNAWASYYARQGTKVVFANGKLGMGAMKLSRLAKALAGGVNVKRKAKGLLPRPVRAGIIGYPNVGKSSLINRLLKRRMCTAAARPGVTRVLKWVRFGEDLELLDSPGMIPMRINDQSAAIKLAICDDIGERSYDVSEVAAILVQLLARLPTVGYKALHDRYKIEADGCVGKIFVEKLALRLFNGDSHQAAFRILSDFRKGKFGWVALERPPKVYE